ncbi:MAG TPA: DUF2231 domain-containing protein [Candidatus Acidoferrales bacterium]|nr:DUF2231 domain-containing protein [Candidatus Acidoferrales bacterium]
MGSLLPGWTAALNHHPAFVHFPIVLWLAALLFEILSLRRRSDPTHDLACYLLYLGTLTAVLAVVTGLNAEATVATDEVAHALEVHEELMLTSFFLATGLSVFAYFSRRRLTHALKMVLLAGLVLLALLVTLGADRGAEMVYRYGLGVNWSTAIQQK